MFLVIQQLYVIPCHSFLKSCKADYISLSAAVPEPLWWNGIMSHFCISQEPLKINANYLLLVDFILWQNTSQTRGDIKLNPLNITKFEYFRKAPRASITISKLRRLPCVSWTNMHFVTVFINIIWRLHYIVFINITFSKRLAFLALKPYSAVKISILII